MGFNIPFFPQGQKNKKTHDFILRIMTFNLGNSSVDINSLSDFIKRTQPDIIALQKAYAERQPALKAILSPDKWNLAFQGDLGLASRLKIKKVDMKNGSIAGGRDALVSKYELEGKMGLINFFNVHFQTLRDGLEGVIDNGVGGFDKIRRITEIQEKEANIISQWSKSHKPGLVSGDFNMPVVNPIYRKHLSRFTDAFSKTGFGFGYTYYTRWHGIRIDHILCDGDWKVVHSEVGPYIGSDHRPVVADVEFIGQQFKLTQADEPQKQMVQDRSLLIYENFETFLGKLQNYGMADITIDTHNWDLASYPIVSFAYMIPERVTLEMRVKTIYHDWIDLKDTRLINDGKWHEISIDARTVMKSVLPGVKYLTEFQFYIPEERYQKNTFWIDYFMV